jgi:hypothetical protein
MAVVTINPTGPLSLQDIALAVGYGNNQVITLNDIEMRMLARGPRAGGPVSMDSMHGAVRISQTGVAGTATGFVGWSSGVAGSLTGSVVVKGATMVEIGQSNNNTCTFALTNTTNPGATWIHGVTVKNNNGSGAFGYASEASYFWNANTLTAVWVWNGGWNMTSGTGFTVYIYY